MVQIVGLKYLVLAFKVKNISIGTDLFEKT
jgi:hypothetical protein